MSINSSEQAMHPRIRYLHDLSTAIEEYTLRRERADPDSWRRAGADLRHAVERLLFFRHVNNQRLFALFTASLDGFPASPVVVRSRIERDLVPLLTAGRIPPERIVFEPDRHSLRRLLRRAREALGRYRRDRRLPRPRRPAAGAELVVYVNHPKLVTYLQPVLAELDRPTAFLVTPGSTLRPFFAEQGLPFVVSKRVRRRRPTHPAGAELGHLFRDFEAISHTLTELGPRCILLAEGNQVDDELINRAARRLGIPVVCIQQGWCPIVHNGFRHLTFTKMLVWGEGFVELLRPYSPRQAFVVTGNHTLAAPPPADAADRRSITFFLQCESMLISPAAWQEFLALLRRVAATLTGTPIRVREHPNHPLPQATRAELERFPHLEMVPHPQFRMAEVLATTLLSVTIYSTTILESIAAGVVPLVVNLTPLPRYSPDVAAAGAGIEVHGCEEAFRVLARAAGDPGGLARFAEPMARFRRRYFDQGERPAVERIAGEIVVVMETSS